MQINPFVIEETNPCETINNDAGTDKVTKKIVQLLDERVRSQ